MSRQKKPSGRREPLRRQRSESEFGRAAGERPQNKIILIVCEGRQTEPRYFKALAAARREPGITVRIKHSGKDLLPLIKVAIQEGEAENLDPSTDEIWCVFDTEQAGARPRLAEAISSATGQGVRLGVSNPAFEYWYLLHFEKTDRPFANAADLIGALRKHIPKYEKNLPWFDGCLQPLTDRALQNAQQLKGQNKKRWTELENPSTGVDQLVKAIWESTPRFDSRGTRGVDPEASAFDRRA